MTVPLFHENNSFCIYKNNQELKTINFGGHKIGLYYKLYSILRKKHNYHLRTATIMSPISHVLMQGSLHDIIYELVEELKKEHAYTIISENSENGNVYHWRDDVSGVIDQLTFLKEKYTKSGDPRLYSKVQVISNESGISHCEKLDDLIHIFSTFETPAEEEAEFGVYLRFEEVLKDMRPLIMSGTDKEKIEAKAILAYVATKLAEA